MITSAWKFGKDVDEVISIRNTVNLFSEASDEKSMHLIIYDNEVPAGCLSLFFENGSYNIKHVAVVPEFQRQYIGDLMMRVAMVKAFNMMAERIRLVPTPATEEFFKKYGFAKEQDYMEVTPQTLIMNSKCGHDCSKCINKEHCSK